MLYVHVYGQDTSEDGTLTFNFKMIGTKSLVPNNELNETLEDLQMAEFAAQFLFVVVSFFCSE